MKISLRDYEQSESISHLLGYYLLSSSVSSNAKDKLFPVFYPLDPSNTASLQEITVANSVSHLTLNPLVLSKRSSIPKKSPGLRYLSTSIDAEEVFDVGYAKDNIPLQTKYIVLVSLVLVLS